MEGQLQSCRCGSNDHYDGEHPSHCPGSGLLETELETPFSDGEVSPPFEDLDRTFSLNSYLSSEGPDTCTDEDAFADDCPFVNLTSLGNDEKHHEEETVGGAIADDGCYFAQNDSSLNEDPFEATQDAGDGYLSSNSQSMSSHTETKPTKEAQTRAQALPPAVTPTLSSSAEVNKCKVIVKAEVHASYESIQGELCSVQRTQSLPNKQTLSAVCNSDTPNGSSAELTRCKEIEHAEVHASYRSLHGIQSLQNNQTSSVVCISGAPAAGSVELTRCKKIEHAEVHASYRSIQGELCSAQRTRSNQTSELNVDFQPVSVEDEEDSSPSSDEESWNSCTDDSNYDVDQPVVNLVAEPTFENGGAPHEGAVGEVIAGGGSHFAWDNLPATQNSLQERAAIRRHNIPSYSSARGVYLTINLTDETDHEHQDPVDGRMPFREYLYKQGWCRVTKEKNENLLIMIHDVDPEEARRDILANTDLTSGDFSLRTYFSLPSEP